MNQVTGPLLAAFAEDVLDRLQGEEDWNSGTLQWIAERAQKMGLCEESVRFLRKDRVRGADGAVYWAEAETGGWVVMRRLELEAAAPLSDVLYTHWSDATLAAMRAAAS